MYSLFTVACLRVVLGLVTAGSPAQIDAVFEAGLFPPLIALFPRSTSVIQREVCFVFRNAVHGATRFQLQRLFDLGFLPALCSLLQSDSPTSSLTVALDCIEHMLSGTTDVMPKLHRDALQQIEKCNGRVALQSVASSETEVEVREQAAGILEFFPRGQEEEEANSNAAATFSEDGDEGQSQ